MIRQLLPFCFAAIFSAAIAVGQPAEPLRPEWCRQLPRPEYGKLERVLSDEPWFEIYRIRPGVFAIYEPKQFEEVISYLILGEKRAVLFDTGLGVGRISTTVARLTSLPVTVINSHTHFDHVGGNAEFQEIWNRDLPYTQQNMRGQPNVYSRDALAPERLCGPLPPGTKPESYSIRRWSTAPAEEHVQRLIDFVGNWDRVAPMVVHCFAGISRSTAGAYVAACALNPQRDEMRIAWDIRRASRTAQPNARIVSIADRLLRRDGRMVRAIETIGPGQLATEGDPFRLDIA